MNRIIERCVVTCASLSKEKNIHTVTDIDFLSRQYQEKHKILYQKKKKYRLYNIRSMTNHVAAATWLYVYGVMYQLVLVFLPNSNHKNF